MWLGTARETEVLAHGGQLPSRLHAKDFGMWAATSEHHTETT